MSANQVVDILLITATSVETEALHAVLQPLPGRSSLNQEYLGSNVYTLGRLGNYGIIHVETGMGSVGARASQLTVAEAITHWKPKFILMLGIAFGKDSATQSIGDVFIGGQIIPYEIQRVGELETIPRRDRTPASPILVNRFIAQKNGSSKWKKDGWQPFTKAPYSRETRSWIIKRNEISFFVNFPRPLAGRWRELE